MECCLQILRRPPKLAKTQPAALERNQPSSVQDPAGETLPKYLSRAYDPPCIIIGNLQKFVKLPEYAERKEWLATHAYEFFHLVNAYYGSISSHCTLNSCPIMRIRNDSGVSALIWPPEFVMTSREDHSSRSSMTTMFFSASNTFCREISAANYIDSSLTWIETQLESPERFPRAMKGSYPKDFEKRLIIPMFQLLYQILNHMYEFHYENICELEEEPHLNALLCHFITIGREFVLFPSIEVNALGRLVDRIFPPLLEGVEPVNLVIRRLSDADNS